MDESRYQTIMLILIVADCAGEVHASRRDFINAMHSIVHALVQDPSVGTALHHALYRDKWHHSRLAQTDVEDWT